MSSRLRDIYGEYIDLGYCTIGRNLNVVSARGYASLITLAQISGPDILDPILNPSGTQRDLNLKHSEEAFEYALGAAAADPSKDPRAFPEVTLNARDMGIFRFTLISGGEITEIDFENISEELIPETNVLKIQVRVDALISPVPPHSPQISRIDGNHRLSQAQIFFDNTEEDPEVLKTISEDMNVPFALFVGLTPAQERKIFSAYNGKHAGMPPAIIDNFEMNANSTLENIATIKGASRWLAVELQKEGRPFHGKVHLGGSRVGAKQLFGEAPPLTNRGLATAIRTTLQNCNQLQPRLLPEFDLSDPTEMTEQRKEEHLKDAEKMLSYLDLYWTAVRDAFPNEWDDKRTYILMSSIGIGGFSQLAAPVIENLVVSKGTRKYEHFRAVMEFMAREINLERVNFQGVAGAGGTKRIAEMLIKHWSRNEVHVDIAIADKGGFQHGLNS